MSYFEYVAAAYAVFLASLLWDYAWPRWQLLQTRREILRRAQREQARAGKGTVQS